MKIWLKRMKDRLLSWITWLHQNNSSISLKMEKTLKNLQKKVEFKRSSKVKLPTFLMIYSKKSWKERRKWSSIQVRSSLRSSSELPCWWLELIYVMFYVVLLSSNIKHWVENDRLFFKITIYWKKTHDSKLSFESYLSIKCKFKVSFISHCINRL